MIDLNELSAISEGDRMEIYNFLHFYTGEVKGLTEDMTDTLMESASEDRDFRCQIRKWLNHTSDTGSYELEVNGFWLSDIINKYRESYPDTVRLGILISIYLLWIEKTRKNLHNICFYVDGTCYTDIAVRDGDELCYEAIFLDNGWYFMGKELSLSGKNVEEFTSEYDTWIILRNNPLLFVPLGINWPVGTRLVLDSEKSGYYVDFPTDF